MNWKNAAACIRWKVQPFVGGRYVPSAAREFFDKINPANETTLFSAPVGDAADVEGAVRSARARFADGAWSEQTGARRAEVLLRLADLIVRHQRDLAVLDTMEMGKPATASLHDAAGLAAPRLRGWAGFADKLTGSCAQLAGGSLAFNVYEPRGVIGAIAPWNFPTLNAVYKIGPALAAGNSVVLKPSELSPSSALKLAELALEAGVPEGVLNVVPGLGSTVGAALASHPDVDMISFTGSTTTGRKIMEMCGRSNGKPLILECGGKSPHVVFNDVADLDAVADAVVLWAFSNQGQVCVAHTRLIAHDDIKELLLEKVVKRVEAINPGDPLDESTTFGPLASDAQRARVKAYIDEGLRAGAIAVIRGAIQDRGGCYVGPTVFDHVNVSMSIVQEEIFGPVLCVESFKTDEEAVALANGTTFGLAATVWTRDLDRARRLAHAIRAGSISIRTGRPIDGGSDHFLSREPQKASGFGVELGLGGLQSYSTLKAVTVAGDRRETGGVT